MVVVAPNPFLLAADRLDPPAHPYADDPVGYARDVLGFHAWSKQREILESVRDHARTSVRACHGPGKTATAAQAAIWFLDTHPNSRVVTTAPIWAQVEQLLWREIRGAIARAHHAGRAAGIPAPSATKLEIGEQWFAIGLSTNEPERFQGHHADHLLLIVDEASGVDEQIFEAAEGFMTAQGAHVLLLGNPTRVGGTFHRSHTSERAEWNTIRISVFDTPNYTGEPVPEHVARALPRSDWAGERAKVWGEQSIVYQVRVLGEFPEQAEDSVIGLAAVEAAQARELPGDLGRDHVRIGVDVARYGSDETVIARRTGQEVRLEDAYRGRPVTDTARLVAGLARQSLPHVTTIVIDDAGVGGGVTDLLREDLGRDGYRIIPFNGANKAYRDEFPNRRSELWFELAAQLDDLDLDPDEQLLADITAPRYRMDLKNRRVVEPKDETKKRLGRSPDRADAVMLTLVQPPVSGLPASAPRAASITDGLLTEPW